MRIKKDDPVLIFGAGSIGERHVSILQKLGYSNIWIYRQRNLPLRNINESSVHIFTDLSLTDQIKPKAAIICTPTFQHVEQALFCVDHGIHVLIEKPLSHNLNNIDTLQNAAIKNKVYVKTAYMLRFHPIFQTIKSKIESRETGKLISMQTYWGEYLPDWHPWEDYRQSYVARKELGGGVSLTLSHDIDLVNWLSESEVTKWNMLKNYRSSLDVNVESGADILLGYQNGITAHCHLNFYEQKAKRSYHFVFENGTIEVDYLKSLMKIVKKQEIITHSIPDFDRNQLYELQTLDFFKKINDGNFMEDISKSMKESKMIITICQ